MIFNKHDRVKIIKKVKAKLYGFGEIRNWELDPGKVCTVYRDGDEDSYLNDKKTKNCVILWNQYVVPKKYIKRVKDGKAIKAELDHNTADRNIKKIIERTIEELNSTLYFNGGDLQHHIRNIIPLRKLEIFEKITDPVHRKMYHILNEYKKIEEILGDETQT